MWGIQFPHRIAFADPEKPQIVGTLRAQREEVSAISLYLDTGAQFSLFDQQVLEAFDFAVPAERDPKDERWQAFGGGNGKLWGYRFDDLQVSVDGTPLVVTLPVYAAAEELWKRNVLGRDFLRKFVAGFDLYGATVYLRDRSTGSGVDDE